MFLSLETKNIDCNDTQRRVFMVESTTGLKKIELPDKAGRFGEYGGSYVPEQLQAVLDEITQSYNAIKNNDAFIAELKNLNKHFTGSTHVNIKKFLYCAWL